MLCTRGVCVCVCVKMLVYTHKYTHSHFCSFFLGYMLSVVVMEVPASNQWNTLIHTLTSGVCVLQCQKDVEVWELQHTTDSYMLLEVMMPLLLAIVPSFLAVWNGKIFLFKNILICQKLERGLLESYLPNKC